MPPTALALPQATLAHPSRESCRNEGAVPEVPARLLVKGGHPCICPIVLHGDRGGMGEGKRLHGASGSGRDRDSGAGAVGAGAGCGVQVQDAWRGEVTRRAATLPLWLHWMRLGMGTGRGAGP